MTKDQKTNRRIIAAAIRKARKGADPVKVVRLWDAAYRLRKVGA